MSPHLTRIVEAFNACRLDEVVAYTTTDYHPPRASHRAPPARAA